MSTPVPRRSTLALLAALIALLRFAPSAIAAPVDPEAAFAKAREAFVSGDYDRSIELLQAANQVEPRAVYVFNIARSYEEKGWLREAYDHFVLYPTQSRTTKRLLDEASARAAALRPLLDRAVVVLRGGEAARLELDGETVADPGRELVLDPGVHQLCSFDPSPTRATCWRRSLAAARRVQWPPPDDAGERGRLRLPPDIAAVGVDGIPVGTGSAPVRELSLDAGLHALSVRTTAGAEHDLQVRVVAGGLVEVELPRAPVEVQASSGSSPWPWVVFGVGAASVAAGAGLLIVAGVERGELTSPTRDGGVIVSFTQAQAQTRWERVDTFVITGSVLAGAGAALSASGLTWWALESDGEAAGIDGSPRTELWIGATGPASLGLGGTF